MNTKPKSRLLLSAVVAGVAAVGALAPSAQAAYPNFPAPNNTKCSGDSLAGRGASFQNVAQTTWRVGTKGFYEKNCNNTAFDPVPGPQSKTISYDPAGSGAGRNALGASGGVRDANIRFGGYDQPPTPAQKATMQAGLAGPADDAILHDVPVANAAVVVDVNFPNGCTLPLDEDQGAWQPKDDGTTRFITASGAIEQVFAGQITTWGAFVPGIQGAGCSSKPITRVVRNDSSGTTFIFKKWLESVDDAVNDINWDALGNTAWPNDAGPTAVKRGGGDNTVNPDGTVNQNTVEPDCATDPTNPATGVNGNGPQADCLADTDGGIGFNDLADARQRGFTKSIGGAGSFDDTFWLPIINGDGDPAEPTKSKKGAVDNKRGSNCSKAIYSGIPMVGNKIDTKGDWTNTLAVNSTKGYPICGLTYMGVWDDYADAYGNTPAEQAKARTVFDYLTFIVGPGQALLPAQDYDKVPGKILGASKAVVKTGGMDWNKP